MKRLKRDLKNYLRNAGMIGEIPLGEQVPTEHESKLLFQEIKRRNKYNSALLYGVFVMMIIIFGVGILLLLRSSTSMRMSLFTYSGTFVIFVGIVRLLFQFWKEKFILDHVSIVLIKSSPETAAELILQIYKYYINKNAD